LTGGQFGPEASLVAVLVCLSAASFILWRIVRLNRIQPPIWSRPTIPGPAINQRPFTIPQKKSGDPPGSPLRTS
jgi:hypothetical protein